MKWGRIGGKCFQLSPPYIDSTRPSGEFYHLAVNMGLLNKGGILVCAGRKSA